MLMYFFGHGHPSYDTLYKLHSHTSQVGNLSRPDIFFLPPLPAGIGKKGKKNIIVYPGQPEGHFLHTLTRDTLTRLKQSTPSVYMQLLFITHNDRLYVHV